MAERLVLTLDDEATKKYLELASKATEDEVNAGCEPSGVCLNIVLGGDFDGHAVWVGDVEIGEASVSFEGNQ